MASCFNLIDKSTNKPVDLVLVDERICKEVYQCEPDINWWGGNVFNWYDTIGFMLANGKTLDNNSEKSILKYYQESNIWKEELPIIKSVIDFLNKNYFEEIED